MSFGKAVRMGDKPQGRQSVTGGKRRSQKDNEEESQLAAISNAVQNAANIQVGLCLRPVRRESQASLLVWNAPPPQAIIRLRPAKKSKGEVEYIECNPRIGSQLICAQPTATLDYTDRFTAVLGSQSSQADAFRVCGLPIVEATLSGRSTCRNALAAKSTTNT